jgi:hypothetical protein
MFAGTGAWASGRDQDRAPAPSRQPVPDNGSVSPAARKSYEDFWKRLPKSKADALERELNALDARQRRGEGTCTGLSWIECNGRVRCIGKLTT